MANSLLDFLGGGFQPTGEGGLLANLGMGDNSYQGIMNSLNNNRGALMGLGLGLMSGTKYNPYGNVMQGALLGMRNDQLDAYRRAQLQQSAEDRAFRWDEAKRAQGNWQKDYDLRTEIANKPQVHWPKEYEDEDGNRVQPPPVLVYPSGKITPLDPKMPPAGVAPPTAPGPQVGPGNAAGIGLSYPGTEEDASMPANAQLAQEGGPPVVGPSTKYRGPEAYRKKANTEQAEADVKNRENAKTGEGVLSLIAGLRRKTESPLFEEAAGPMQAEVSQSPMWDPRRLAYEYTKLGPSVKAQGFLREIQSDTQAINSQLQKALLSGMGSAANWERQEIDKILGQIPAARNKEEARALLDNAESLIKTIFNRGYNVPQGGPPQAGGGGTTKSGIKWNVE